MKLQNSSWNGLHMYLAFILHGTEIRDKWMLILWRTMLRHNNVPCSQYEMDCGRIILCILSIVFILCCTHLPMSNPSSNTLFGTDLSLSNGGFPGGKLWRDSCCSFNWRRRFLLHNSWQSWYFGRFSGGILCEHIVSYIHIYFSHSLHFRHIYQFLLQYLNVLVTFKII